MNNQKPPEQTILEELQKTGYPTEIVSASVMQQRGWTVIHNPSYLDDSEGRSREFDIRAYRQWRLDASGKKFTIGVYLITECKKSEKPWVFFITPEEYKFSPLGELIKNHIEGRHVFTGRYQNLGESVISDDVLRKFHHYFQKQNLARTFHEPFKGQEKADRSQMIYSAVMSSIKATLFHQRDRPAAGWLGIYYPLIIFDGDLFEAQVAPNKVIKLSPSNHIQLLFNYMLPTSSEKASIWESQQKFIVDVVRENYLDQFLKVIEDEHETLKTYLQQGLSEKGTS